MPGRDSRRTPDGLAATPACQPGPRTHGHGASPHAGPDAEWVLAIRLRPPRRETTTTPHKPARRAPSLSMIVRRSSASSSFVLAATRLRALQLGPLPHGDVTGQLRGRSRRTVRPARRHHASHRVRSAMPLDTNGPYGCREQGLSAVLGAEPHRMSVSFGRTMQNSFPSGSARTVQDSAPVWPMSGRRAPSARRRSIS